MIDGRCRKATDGIETTGRQVPNARSRPQKPPSMAGHKKIWTRRGNATFVPRLAPRWSLRSLSSSTVFSSAEGKKKNRPITSRISLKVHCSAACSVTRARSSEIALTKRRASGGVSAKTKTKKKKKRKKQKKQRKKMKQRRRKNGKKNGVGRKGWKEIERRGLGRGGWGGR